MLRIKLLGPGQATCRGQPVPGFPDQRSGQLLSYLLVHRYRPLPRERVAAAFWPDHPTSTSRKYLRDALWRLRRALQSVDARDDRHLAVTKESISLVDSGELALDVEQFEEAVSQTLDLAGQDLTGDQAEELQAAVGLYRGDLLEGLFADWCLNDRERLRLLFLRSLTKLMVYHQHQGDFETAIGFGKRILHHDRTREAVQRRMMRLHWRSGDRAGALKQFRDLSTALRDNLGVRPSARTRRLHRKIQVGRRLEPRQLTINQIEPSSDRPTAQQALKRLGKLRQLLKRTNQELRQLEESFRLVLLNEVEG